MRNEGGGGWSGGGAAHRGPGGRGRPAGGGAGAGRRRRGRRRAGATAARRTRRTAVHARWCTCSNRRPPVSEMTRWSGVLLFMPMGLSHPPMGEWVQALIGDSENGPHLSLARVHICTPTANVFRSVSRIEHGRHLKTVRRPRHSLTRAWYAAFPPYFVYTSCTKARACI